MKAMQKVIEAVVANHGLTEQFWQAIETRSEFYLSVENRPYMRLVIEVTPEGFVSAAHYYEQHGDAMRDPEVVFNPATWLAVEYTQDNLGTYQRVKEGFYSPSLESFCKTWAKNLKEQGFCDIKPA